MPASSITVRRVEVEDEPPVGVIRWLISCDESGIGGSPYYGFGTLWMPYQTQLIPLSVMCAELGDEFEKDTVRQKLARWYWSGVFGELYGGANEARFAFDVPEVLDWIVSAGNEPRTIRDANFAPPRLLSLQSRLSAAYTRCTISYSSSARTPTPPWGAAAPPRRCAPKRLAEPVWEGRCTPKRQRTCPGRSRGGSPETPLPRQGILRLQKTCFEISRMRWRDYEHRSQPESQLARRNPPSVARGTP
jgi:hypothetical protein